MNLDTETKGRIRDDKERKENDLSKEAKGSFEMTKREFNINFIQAGKRVRNVLFLEAEIEFVTRGNKID